jgi:hypothetical protein
MPARLALASVHRWAFLAASRLASTQSRALAAICFRCSGLVNKSVSPATNCAAVVYFLAVASVMSEAYGSRSATRHGTPVAAHSYQRYTLLSRSCSPALALRVPS